MAELTLVSCPTCGLPAEVLWVFRKDLGEGFVEHTRTRCVVLHLDVIQRGPEAQPQRRRRATPPEERSMSLLMQVLRQMARAGGKPVLWSGFGAAAVLLVLLSPAVGLVLIPLAIPVAGVAAARKSWRPLTPAASLSLPATGDGGSEGQRAA